MVPTHNVGVSEWSQHPVILIVELPIAVEPKLSNLINQVLQGIILPMSTFVVLKFKHVNPLVEEEVCGANDHMHIISLCIDGKHIDHIIFQQTGAVEVVIEGDDINIIEFGSLGWVLLSRVQPSSLTNSHDGVLCHASGQ